MIQPDQDQQQESMQSHWRDLAVQLGLDPEAEEQASMAPQSAAPEPEGYAAEVEQSETGLPTEIMREEEDLPFPSTSQLAIETSHPESEPAAAETASVRAAAPSSAQSTEDLPARTGRRRRRRKRKQPADEQSANEGAVPQQAGPADESAATGEGADAPADTDKRRRRSRRRRAAPEPAAQAVAEIEQAEEEQAEPEEEVIEPKGELDEDEDLSTWNLPSWQELIALLYRPER